MFSPGVLDTQYQITFYIYTQKVLIISGAVPHPGTWGAVHHSDHLLGQKKPRELCQSYNLETSSYVFKKSIFIKLFSLSHKNPWRILIYLNWIELTMIWKVNILFIPKLRQNLGVNNQLHYNWKSIISSGKTTSFFRNWYFSIISCTDIRPQKNMPCLFNS